MAKLTVKQEKFITSYVQTGNAQQSAIDAGYPPKSAHSIATENLQKPAIIERRKELEAQINSPKIADVKERKEKASEIIRAEVKSPVTAKECISAIAELNKMEHIYDEKPQWNDNRIFNILVSSEKAKELTERIGRRLDAIQRQGVTEGNNEIEGEALQG